MSSAGTRDGFCRVWPGGPPGLAWPGCSFELGGNRLTGRFAFGVAGVSYSCPTRREMAYAPSPTFGLTHPYASHAACGVPSASHSNYSSSARPGP